MYYGQVYSYNYHVGNSKFKGTIYSDSTYIVSHLVDLRETSSVLTNETASLEGRPQLPVSAVWKQWTETLAEHQQHQQQNKKPRFSGLGVLTSVKPIQKALIFPKWSSVVMRREKFFPGDNFCHAEPGPVSLAQKYVFLLTHGCKSHFHHPTPPSSENVAVQKCFHMLGAGFCLFAEGDKEKRSGVASLQIRVNGLLQHTYIE